MKKRHQDDSVSSRAVIGEENQILEGQHGKLSDDEKIRSTIGTDENGFELQLSDKDFVKLMPPERQGRPRGYGSGVTYSTIYGSCRNESDKVEALKEKILNIHKEKNEEVEKIKEEMQDKYCEMKEEMQDNYDQIEAKYDELQSMYEDTVMEMRKMRELLESNNQVSRTSNNSDGNFELPHCKLLDPLDPLRVIAEGRLSSTNSNDRVHGVRFGHNGVRVFVDKVLVPKAPLWRGSTKMMYIEEAKNSIVAWPRDKVCIDEA